MTFVTPKTPQYSQGLLVIESDDGYAGDYSHWLPTFTRLARKYNSWQPNRAVVGNSAACSYNIDLNISFMTPANLLKLESMGWEILSHGRRHIGIGAKNVIAIANAGQNRIDINLIGRTLPDHKYRIWNGETEEVVDVVSRTPSDGGEVDGYVTTFAPLANTYPIGSKFQLYDHAIEMGECKSQLEGWGLTVKHHVYPYHDTDDIGKGFAALYFDSARGGDGVSYIPDPEAVNPYWIPSYYINASTNLTTIDTVLTQVAAIDGMLFVYGHGEQTYTMKAVLEHIIDTAFDKGIRIVTHDQALRLKGII